jgi:hypothetical protein
MAADPSFKAKLSRLTKDRILRRKQRKADLPATISRQEDSDNEFVWDESADFNPSQAQTPSEGDSSSDEG